MSYEIELVQVLSDNYAVLLHDKARGMCILIDAPEEEAISARLNAKGWNLTHILLTHHHSDHVAGVAGLVQAYGAKVIGNRADAARLPSLDIGVDAGEVFTLGESRVRVIDTPGHTVGHIAFFFEGEKLLFAGDTLFAGGCGRLFEGSPQQMYASLKRLEALGDDVQIYCGHEYTLSNLRFALSVDAENEALVARMEEAQARRAKGLPTVPSLMALEKATNPYLLARDLSEFTERRAKKDRF